MNYLIDTHIFLWMMAGDIRLSQKYIDEIENESNSIYISKVSLWEIAIKVGIGKLELFRPIISLESYLIELSFKELEVKYQDLRQLTELPFHHQDPFDRLIISQAIVNNFTIITDDNKFKSYPVQLL